LGYSATNTKHPLIRKLKIEGVDIIDWLVANPFGLNALAKLLSLTGPGRLNSLFPWLRNSAGTLGVL